MPSAIFGTQTPKRNHVLSNIEGSIIEGSRAHGCKTRKANTLPRKDCQLCFFVYCKTTCVVLLLCAIAAIPSLSETFTVLVDFTGPNGTDPSALVQGPDGNFYGTTYTGGANDLGTIFKISPNGNLTIVHSFAFSEGYYPYSGLLLANDGNFYGTTSAGYANGGNLYSSGTVYKLTPTGELTTIYAFCSQSKCNDGAFPGGLIQAKDGNFYGTTQFGGTFNRGTVFKITSAGTLTTLYSFYAQTTQIDPYWPSVLVQATDGNFYGTTLYGGKSEDQGRNGAVFKITPDGTETTLYRFCSQFNCADGALPNALIQASDGNLYGTTRWGGANFYAGTIFKITLSGSLTTFDVDPGEPFAGLIEASDGFLYGTGASKEFKMTPPDTLKYLHRDSRHDGYYLTGLLQATDGNFYGTAGGGGDHLAPFGTAFKLTSGLPPFVQLVPATGAVGQTIQILGQGFTGVTEVFFDATSTGGESASYTVLSDTYMTAIVPSKATSGYVVVVTSKGPLSSNKKFVVEQ